MKKLVIRQEEDQNRNCALVPIIREMFPYFRETFARMQTRGNYLTDEDYERGCELAYIQEAMMFCNAFDVINEIGVLLATSLMREEAGQTVYRESMEAVFPKLATLLDDAETLDTTGELDRVHRFKQATGGESSTTNQNLCSLAAILISALSDGAIPPAVALMACQTLSAGGEGAENLLESINAGGVAKASNQNEGYLYEIAKLMGPTTIGAPD